MLARAVALFLIAPALAGCLAALDPGATGARVTCIEGVCNHEATLTPPERQANELSIAVNPLDPLNIIATGKDYTPEYAGDCVWDGLYVTKDGGVTWMNMNLPGSPWKRLQDPTEPVTEFSPFWCATDPVVRFGPDGTAYWTVMPYQCDRASGSKTGRGVHPDGGFNDWLWTCSSMFVLVSEDGGETWPKVRRVAVGERLAHDKQWLAVAPDGNTVLLCWDFSAQRAAATETVPEAEPVAGRYGIICSFSRDKGDSWSEPAHVGHGGIFLPWVDFGPDGRAWMAALAGDTFEEVVVMWSDDLETWSDPVTIGPAIWPPPGGEYGWPVLHGSDFRILPLPALAVDRSDGPHAGRVYVTWFTHGPRNGDIMLSSSDDGVTWTPPARVHDDGDSPHDQFMPTVSVGPDGIVDLSWWDRRDDPDNHLFHVYYTFSTDGGATFSPNLRVTDVASDEQFSHHQNGMVFLGDYRDSASTLGAAHLVWVDTRHGQADVFVATIARP